jgi:hypothetical protein
MIKLKRAHAAPERYLMRNFLPKLLVLAATLLPIVAHADTLDVILTGDAHTFVFTLPSQFSFPDQIHLVTVPPIQTAGTADGIAGQAFDVTFFTGIGSPGDSLTFTDVFGGSSFLLTGPVLISPLPQTGTPGNLIDTALLATGSFTLEENSISPKGGPVDFELTITPQSPPNTGVPEPSTLLLFATGMMGLVTAIRHRTRAGTPFEAWG